MILIACSILLDLISFNNNFLKKHVIGWDWLGCHHWLLITALSCLMTAVAWLRIMVLAGQMVLDKIFSHVYMVRAITGKRMVQKDIIQFALKLSLVPSLCVVVSLIMEITFGVIILIRRITKLQGTDLEAKVLRRRPLKNLVLRELCLKLCEHFFWCWFCVYINEVALVLVEVDERSC